MTQADRRRAQNTAQPTAAPSQKLPPNYPTSNAPPQGQPSQKLPKKPAGVPEYGGPLPPTPQQGPTLPPNTGPVFPDDPVQPIGFNGGQFIPTQAPFGMDMSGPGVNEQFWNQNQGLWFQSPQLDWIDSQMGQFQNPWAGEQANQQLLGTIGNPGAGQQFWNGVAGTFNDKTPAQQRVDQGYNGPNNAQTAFDMTKSRIPGSMQPQFDAYYDRMHDKVMSDVNSQSAARGVYGSSSALNNSIGAGLDVEANRAKAATDFSLADSQNQRSWLDSLSGQGRAADLTGQGNFGLNLAAANQGLDRLKTFGDLAFRAEDADFSKKKALSDIAFGLDNSKLDRLGAGISTAFNSDQAHRGRLNDAFGASNIVQNNREDRINSLYNNVTSFSNDAMNFMMSNYDALLGGDKQMSEDEIRSMIAKEADARGWSQQQQERIFRDTFSAINAFNENKAAGEAQG